MTEAYGLILDGPRLRSPVGLEVVLSPRAARVLDRLMHWPGAFVNISDLVVAVWPYPDDEPNSAEVQVRQTLMEVRRAVAAVAGDRVKVRSERGIGTALSADMPLPERASTASHPGQHEVAA